jgi:hypothetical protein
VVEVSALDGALRIEEFGLRQAAGLYLAGSDLYFSAVKPSGEYGLFRLRAGEIIEVAASPAGMPTVLLVETPELAVAGVPGTGLFELRPDAEPRLVARAPSFAPAAALIPGGRWLVFGREAEGGYEYFLLDLASGEERPLAGPLLAGEILAVGGIPQSPFIRGDSNGDGLLDISDPVRTLIHLFLGAGPLECPDAADADDSGALDITDPIRLLDFLFLGGPPLPPPYPVPGLDPTPDALDCR